MSNSRCSATKHSAISFLPCLAEQTSNTNPDLRHGRNPQTSAKRSRLGGEFPFFPLHQQTFPRLRCETAARHRSRTPSGPSSRHCQNLPRYTQIQRQLRPAPLSPEHPQIVRPQNCETIRSFRSLPPPKTNQFSYLRQNPENRPPTCHLHGRAVS